MKVIAEGLEQPFIDFLLSIADEKFFLGHRNGDWTGLGPFLEEDIAFSNIAQDEIAHAQELYKLAAGVIDPNGDLVVRANHLAYSRPANERFSAVLVEMVDDYNWAVAITRQFFYDHYDMVRLPRLQKSCYKPLADLAGKMLQEVGFHVRHFDGWVEKLGCGTKESKQKLQQAVELLWPETSGLFEPIGDQEKLIDAGLYPGDEQSMQRDWSSAVGNVLSAAGITVPPSTTYQGPGGRRGQHAPELVNLLADLAEVYEYEPGASW